MTHKDQVMKYLTRKGSGTAADIMKGTKLSRSAVYSGLSLLKEEKKVSNEDSIWTLEEAVVLEKALPEPPPKGHPFRDQQVQAMRMTPCPTELESAMKELIQGMQASHMVSMVVTLEGNTAVVRAQRAPPEENWRVPARAD